MQIWPRRGSILQSPAATLATEIVYFKAYLLQRAQSTPARAKKKVYSKVKTSPCIFWFIILLSHSYFTHFTKFILTRTVYIQSQHTRSAFRPKATVPLKEAWLLLMSRQLPWRHEFFMRSSTVSYSARWRWEYDRHEELIRVEIIAAGLAGAVLGDLPSDLIEKYIQLFNVAHFVE